MTSKKRSIAALAAAVLVTALTAPAAAVEAPAIRVSSYKGSTLEVGERNGLIIGPSGTEYTVTSSNPETVVFVKKKVKQKGTKKVSTLSTYKL